MADTNDTAGPAGPARRRRRFNPVIAVAAIAVIAFVVAFLAFRGGAKSSKVDASGQVAASTTAPGTSTGTDCIAGTANPAYTVTMQSEPTPPRAEGTVFHLTVRHDGKAVTGAKVCMTADMTEMHHAGIADNAKETTNGTYDLTLKFGMRGPYQGSVNITEPGKSPVTATVSFPVN